MKANPQMSTSVSDQTKLPPLEETRGVQPACPNLFGLIDATSNVNGLFCAAVTTASDNSKAATMKILMPLRISILGRFLHAVDHEYLDGACLRCKCGPQQH